MTVETLREAIKERAQDLLGEALVKAGTVSHKRGWRDCPCSWCDTKREATRMIGSGMPYMYLTRGTYVEDLRHIWRDEQRVKYRAALALLERN